MRYDRLVEKVSEMSGVPRSHIKRVLRALPEALLDLQPEKTVRTPLGVFRGVYRPRRKSRLPTGEEVWVEAEFHVKLKESTRLSKPAD